MSRNIICPLKTVGKQSSAHGCNCSPFCAWFVDPDDVDPDNIPHDRCVLHKIAAALSRVGPTSTAGK